MNFDLVVNPPAFGDLAMVNAVSRSGKKLACRILSRLEGVDYYQYVSSLEMVCFLSAMKKMDDTAAACFLRTAVDEAVYNRALGRYLNTRRSDESSVLNADDPDTYLTRVTEDDTEALLGRFQQERRLSLFHVHSVLAVAPLLARTFPDMRVVHIHRHPVDLADDWFRRGWGTRIGTDPLAFDFLIDSGAGTAPWFAADWADGYATMSPEARCVRSILSLQEMDAAGLAILRSAAPDRLLEISFEDLIGDTETTIDRFCNFFGRNRTAGMSALLEAESCPADIDHKARQNNFERLRAGCGADVLQALSEAAARYEKSWGAGAAPRSSKP
ncbi:MAG: sulfotransferase family protein [Rhodospirillales bacterium]